MPTDYSSWRPIALKRDSVCAECGVSMPLGSRALWSRAKSQVACLSHGENRSSEPGFNGKPVSNKGSTLGNELRENGRPSDSHRSENASSKIKVEDLVIPTVTGIAGGEARRISDKNQAKTDAKHIENKNRMEEAHPLVGGLLSSFYDVVMTDKDVQSKGESRNAHAWKYGAKGEEGIGETLNALGEKYGFYVIHDRKQGKHTSANIDHIVIASDAVYIVDAKNYTGLVEVETNGWLNGNKPVKLKVGGRSQMSIVEGMHKQVKIVEKALEDYGSPMPVIGVLAFYLATWPHFKIPTEIQGVRINGRGLEAILSTQGGYTELARKEAWVAITEALPETK